MAADIARTGVDVEALQARFTPDPDDRDQQGDARVATEQDAARDRVLAARADLAEQVDLLEASAREAVDIPAQDPAKPGQGGGRRRGGSASSCCKARSGSSGPDAGRSAASPRRCRRGCCPRRSRRRCASSATTATRSRAALERDFAEYAKKASKDRAALEERAPAGRGPTAAGPRRSGCRRRHLHARIEKAFSGAPRQDPRAGRAGGRPRTRSVPIWPTRRPRTGSRPCAGSEARRTRRRAPAGPADETAPTGI